MGNNTIKIKKFNQSDFEFEEIARLYNIVSHDDKEHVDDIKDSWAIRDKDRIRDRLFLYNNKDIIGYLGYAQGRDENKKNCYFSIFLDPLYNGNGYRQLLYEKMLDEIKIFECNKLYSDIYDHPNYKECKNLLINNNFSLGLTCREYSLKIDGIDLDQYLPLLDRLDKEGIKFYDSKHQMQNFKNHYKKLEELQWEYSKDFPMPEGIAHTREPFEQYIKEQKFFEDKIYGIEIVATDGDLYIGSTDIEVYAKINPYKAWTGGLGVLKEYRRRGIATAIKIHAIQKLRDKGIKEIRTDNEENNPMYKINVSLGFLPEPFSFNYQKEI